MISIDNMGGFCIIFTLQNHQIPCLVTRTRRNWMFFQNLFFNIAFWNIFLWKLIRMYRAAPSCFPLFCDDSKSLGWLLFVNCPIRIRIWWESVRWREGFFLWFFSWFCFSHVLILQLLLCENVKIVLEQAFWSHRLLFH